MKIRPAPINIMDSIPRGISTKYLKDQRIPQARWQTQEAIEAHKALEYDPKNPNGKILIGAIGDKLIGVAEDRHIGTVAGNRSGKSVGVKNNLFFYNGSVVVIDLKTEHANDTAERRAEMGQDVFVLDPYDRARGKARKYRARYNPLRALTLGDVSVIEKAMQIVDGLIVTSGQEKDPHWNETAGASLLGFILYTAFGTDVPDKERHMGTVRRFVRSARRQEQTDDGAVYTLPRRIMAGIQILYDTGHEDVAEAIEFSVRGLYEKSHEEMAGVASTMNRHTAFLDSISIKDVLSGHDFDLRDVKRKKMTIYLCLPATKLDACKRWLRIFINQLIDAMEEEETVPEAPVLAILDEFPVLGFMQQLQNAIGQIASFHLLIWWIIQDWGQGKSLYKDRWESFTANAGILQCFANVDLVTTEYISKRLGKTPVLATRQGDTSFDQIEKGMSGQSQSKEMYDLLMPDEVARAFARSDPLKRQLIMLAGLHPMIIQRCEYFDESAPYHHHFAGKYEVKA